jgi:hypothetical protein
MFQGAAQDAGSTIPLPNQTMPLGSIHLPDFIHL